MDVWGTVLMCLLVKALDLGCMARGGQMVKELVKSKG